MNRPKYHHLLHVLSVLTAEATLLLIGMGGLVTSHKAGMSVPDWPNSFGYNMFLFPPSQWIGGIFYEHTHRLMGTVVGLLSIALVICAWIRDRRRWARWLAVAVLAAVILQGVLGGLRVVLVNLNLAIVHACVAQAFFCLTVMMAIVTSRWWFTAAGEYLEAPAAGRWLVRLGIITVSVIYLQLVIGAVMRHYNAGLAIPDFPKSYGRWLPPMNAQQLAGANEMRIADNFHHLNSQSPSLDPVTLGQIWLHFGHRIGAVVVSVVVSFLVILAMWLGAGQRRRGVHTRIFSTALLLIFCLAGQITLGILTVLLRKPADVASAHVALGALTLAVAFSLTVMAMRLYNPRRTESSAASEAFDARSIGSPANRRAAGTASAYAVGRA